MENFFPNYSVVYVWAKTKNYIVDLRGNLGVSVKSGNKIFFKK